MEKSVKRSDFTFDTIITLEPVGKRFHYRKLSCNIPRTMLVSSNTSTTENTSVRIWHKDIDESKTSATMKIIRQNSTDDNSTMLVGQTVQDRVLLIQSVPFDQDNYTYCVPPLLYPPPKFVPLFGSTKNPQENQ